MFTKIEKKQLCAAFEAYNAERYSDLDLDVDAQAISFSEKFEKRMDKLVRRQNRICNPVISMFARRVACICLCAITILSMSAIVYVKATGYVKYEVEYKENYARIYFKNSEGILVSFEKNSPSYIPEGFELSEKSGVFGSSYLYLNKEGEFCRYSQSAPSSMEIVFENEPICEKIIINGCDGIFHKKNDVNAVIFSDGVCMYQVGGNVPKEEIIKIAESIELSK